MTADPRQAVGRRLERDGIARHGRWAVLDAGGAAGDTGLIKLGRQVLALLPEGALVLAAPALPFAERLLHTLPPEVDRLQPQDSETCVFLGDIPLLRSPGEMTAAQIAARLHERRGLLTDDSGLLVAQETTAVRAGVIASSLHHAVYVWTLLELLRTGLRPDEDALAELLRRVARPLTETRPALPRDALLRQQLIDTGRNAVRMGLVDSVFGNISARCGSRLLISRTGSALDALEDALIEVPLAGPAAEDRLASSELPAHRAIYAAGDAAVIVHGHPRFTVALSLLRADLPTGVLRISAPPGSPELGTELAAALSSGGIAVAAGHGPFAAAADFATALAAIIQLENACRAEFLHTLDLRE